MLSIRFDSSAKGTPNEVSVQPPYELVATWITEEVRTSPKVTKIYIETLRPVVDGTKASAGMTGDGWELEADREWATLTEPLAHSQPTVRVPTNWLLDALERWREHLLGRGIDPER